MGKTAIVTGGGQGIGAAIVHSFLDHGSTVLVNDLNPKALEALASRARQGERLITHCADATDAEQAAAMVDTALARMGKIDILVNNAAAPVDLEPFTEMSRDLMDRSLASLYAVLTCSQAVLPYMIERQFGRIVNISSISGHIGVPGMSVYSGSKAAIFGFSRALAKEVAAHGVTVNCVAPGTVDTPRQRARPEEVKEARRRAIPMQRFAKPEEVAYAVRFLAGEEAAYITGEVIDVDGGRP